MCVAAAYLNALTGRGVHIVTVNDYLAERDANWMRPVYEALGCTVGIIVSSMDNDARRQAYACDITYGTNNELGFDYLRDNMQGDIAQKVQRGFPFCIVDEIDSILIDEARTPLIISGAGEDDTARYYEVDKYVGLLEEAEKTEQGFYPDESQGEEVRGDYKIDEKSRRISFTNNGMLKMEEILKKHQLIAQDSNISDEETLSIRTILRKRCARMCFTNRMLTILCATGKSSLSMNLPDARWTAGATATDCIRQSKRKSI